MAATKPNLSMCVWLALTGLAHPLLRKHLQKRVVRGKEDPNRWQEKLGLTDAARPQGVLIWLHAVGLGEVLALRGLINKISVLQPDWRFLITSGTWTSAQVLARNMPHNCVHQFLPLDTPQAATRFLDHWHPDLAVWAEQELWPGLVWRCDTRRIPLALVNARMDAASFSKRKKAARIYADALSRFSLVSAQDAGSSDHLTALGAPAVRVDGSLKPIAPPLTVSGLAAAQHQTKGRFIWVVASAHSADVPVALTAHQALLARDPNALLIIAPRDITDGPGIAEAVQSTGLTGHLRSASADLSGQVHIADTFGELGLWYRLAKVACIGGTFDDTQGHNPWEAVRLGTRVICGPQVANFAMDFDELLRSGGATQVTNADGLLRALLDDDHDNIVANAQNVIDQKDTVFDRLSMDLVNLAKVSQ